MEKPAKIEILTLSLLALLNLTGCGQQSIGTNTNPNLSTELKFNKISSERETQLKSLINSSTATNTDQAGSGTSSTANNPVSVPPQAPSAMPAKGATVGSYVSPYYFPQPGNFEQYVVTDYQEAKKEGFSGTYLAALDKVVKPLVSTLASDSKLVNTSGSTDENGMNKSINNQQQVPEYSPYQWQFTYTSTSKKEVYNIYISEKETLVLKQTWGILNMNTQNIKIDSNTAINTIKEAVKNKDFQLPDNQFIYYGSDAEPVYELPAKTVWYFYLEMDKGDLVWNINFSVPYDLPVPTPVDKPLPTVEVTSAPVAGGDSNTGVSTPVTPSTAIYYSGGYARINAATGKIITFNRPVKYGKTYPERIVPPVAAIK